MLRRQPKPELWSKNIFLCCREKIFSFPRLDFGAKRFSTMKMVKNRRFAGFLIFTVKCISAQRT